MWLPEDRQKIFAWQIEKVLKCSECGTRQDEWEDDYNAYYAEADRCIGCEKIAVEQRAWSEEIASTDGLRFRLMKPN